MDRLLNLLSFARVVQGLFVAVVVGLTVTKLLRAPRMKMPPGPLVLPIVGNCDRFVHFLIHLLV